MTRKKDRQRTAEKWTRKVLGEEPPKPKKQPQKKLTRKEQRRERQRELLEQVPGDFYQEVHQPNGEVYVKHWDGARDCWVVAVYSAESFGRYKQYMVAREVDAQEQLDREYTEVIQRPNT